MYFVPHIEPWFACWHKREKPLAVSVASLSLEDVCLEHVPQKKQFAGV